MTSWMGENIILTYYNTHKTFNSLKTHNKSPGITLKMCNILMKKRIEGFALEISDWLQFFSDIFLFRRFSLIIVAQIEVNSALRICANIYFLCCFVQWSYILPKNNVVEFDLKTKNVHSSSVVIVLSQINKKL